MASGGLYGIPAGSPPAGVKQELDGGPTLWPALAGTSAVLLPIMVVTVSCRLYASLRRRDDKGGLKAADYTSAVAAILTIVIVSLDLSIWWLMRHQYDLSIGILLRDTAAKRILATNILSYLVFILARASIFLLYLEIFQVSKAMKIAIWAGIAVSTVAFLTCLSVYCHYCAPLPGQNWSITISLHCGTDRDFTAFLIALAVIAFLIDCYLLLLPIPILARLHMSRKNRIGVMAIFATAIFAVVCALVGIVFRVKIRSSASDLTWIAAQLFITNCVECEVLIIVGAIPGFWSFTNHYLLKSSLLSRLKSSFATNSPSQSSGTSQKELSQKANRPDDHTLNPAVAVTIIRPDSLFKRDSQLSDERAIHLHRTYTVERIDTPVSEK